MTIFADKTDQELAADARMIVSALTRIRTEAAKRGIEIGPADLGRRQGGSDD
jgi:hypothetical protein